MIGERHRYQPAPVSQLLTLQNTMPEAIAAEEGSPLVYTTGSYPYARRKAFSHSVLWNTDEAGCPSTS